MRLDLSQLLVAKSLASEPRFTVLLALLTRKARCVPVVFVSPEPKFMSSTHAQTQHNTHSMSNPKWLAPCQGRFQGGWHLVNARKQEDFRNSGEAIASSITGVNESIRWCPGMINSLMSKWSTLCCSTASLQLVTKIGKIVCNTGLETKSHLIGTMASHSRRPEIVC